MRQEVKQIKQFAKTLNYDPSEYQKYSDAVEKIDDYEVRKKMWDEMTIASKNNYRFPTPIKIKKGTKWCAKSSSGSISGQIICDANIIAITPRWNDCIIFDVPCVKSNSKYSTPEISISPTYLSTDILKQICEQL
jgi:hypothetical protein